MPQPNGAMMTRRLRRRRRSLFGASATPTSSEPAAPPRSSPRRRCPLGSRSGERPPRIGAPPPLQRIEGPRPSQLAALANLRNRQPQAEARDMRNSRVRRSPFGNRGPPPKGATHRPELCSTCRFCPVSQAAGCSPGEPVHDERDAVQSHQGPRCPTARPPPVPLPLWSRLGPTCENTSRVARQAELPAPPRFSRFPAHGRGVPPLPPRRDKGTGGRAAGHKEALT